MPAPPAPEDAAPQDASESVTPPVTLNLRPDTLAGVLAKVWRDNPEVLRAESALRATGYEIYAARSGYFPYAQVQSALAENTEDSQSTLAIVLPLWSGGLTNAQVDTAKARQRAALAELARTRLELGQRTAEAFLNVAQAQEQAAQWDRYVEALDRLLATIQRRSTQGAAPEADVQTALARLRQAEAGRAANNSLLAANRAQLASLMNAVPPRVLWPEDDYLLSEQEISAAQGRAEFHPDRLVALAELEVQEGTARQAKASLWPELAVQHRQQLEGTEFDPSNDATLLVLQYQTGDGVRGAFGYQAEKSRIAEAQARLDSVGREIEATLQSDRAVLQTIGSQLAYQSAASDSASSLVASFMRQFEAGRKSWLEVLNAQREANENQIQFIAVKRNYWLANTRLALDAFYWHRLGAAVTVDKDANPS